MSNYGTIIGNCANVHYGSILLIYNGTFKPAGQSKVSPRDCVSASAVSLLKPH